MRRDIQASVRRPEEEGIVAFIPSANAWAVTVASVPMNRHGLWPQVYPRQQSNDKSIIDAIAGDLRTKGHCHKQQQGRPGPLKDRKFFSWWEAGTSALASQAQKTLHEFMTFLSSSRAVCPFSKKSSDDAGRTDVRGLLAVPECPRNKQTRATVQVFNDANLVGPFVCSLFLLMKPAQESFHTRQYDT